MRLARVLAALGENREIPYPDISTKARAQAFIGLDMKKLGSEKNNFIRNVVPQWIRQATEREKTYD